MLDDPFAWAWRITRQSSGSARQEQAGHGSVPPTRNAAPRGRSHQSADGLGCRWHAPDAEPGD